MHLERFRRAAVICAAFLLLLVAIHGVSESIKHDHDAGAALAVCAAVLALVGGLGLIGGARRPVSVVFALGRSLPVLPVVPRSHLGERLSPAWLQRFLS